MPRQPPRRRELGPAGGLIWIRPPRQRPERLTREAIVTAAIDLADAEGLEAVSIRRVASVLGTRPMGLYSHIARKDDLLDLMLDQVLGEVLLEHLPGNWRDALRAIARHTRTTALHHPWIVVALGRRPAIGPNGIGHREQSLAAVARLDVAASTKAALLQAVDAYTIGHVTLELAEHEIRRRGRLSGHEWRDATQAYLQRLLDTGAFPQLAALNVGDGLSPADQEHAFEAGLDWLLMGFSSTDDLSSVHR